MTPTIAVATETMIVFTTSRRKISFRESTPRNTASSSPSMSALSALPYRIDHAKQSAKNSATSITPCQSAVVKVPRFQKVMLRACGSRATYDRNPVPAPHTAFTAMPASSSVNTFTLPNDVDSRYTSIVAANAPAKASTGTAIEPSGAVNDNAVLPPNTNTRAAPNAAPADVPARPGSTIGFRKSPCISVPDTPNTAPVSPANSTRGSRSWRKTFRLSASALVAGIHPAATPRCRTISAGVNENAPMAADATSSTASSSASRRYV